MIRKALFTNQELKLQIINKPLENSEYKSTYAAYLNDIFIMNIHANSKPKAQNIFIHLVMKHISIWNNLDKQDIDMNLLINLKMS